MLFELYIYKQIMKPALLKIEKNESSNYFKVRRKIISKN